VTSKRLLKFGAGHARPDGVACSRTRRLLTDEQVHPLRTALARQKAGYGLW